MKSVVTVSNALVSAIVDGAPLSDADKQRMLDEVGLAPAVVRDLHARTSILVLSRLWKRLVRATGDDFIGLHIGSAMRGQRFGLGAQVAVHGETFRDALVRFAKYASLVNDLLECRLDDAAPLARYHARLHWNVLGLERHAVDILYAAIVTWAEDHVVAPLVIREIRLRHRVTAGRRRYDELFAAPVVFGADRNELVFDAAILDERIASRDPELAVLLDRYASQELERLPVVTDLPARLAQRIRAELVAGRKVELATLAAQLEMTPRRLQRRLGDHATSFSGLLDDARKALAPALLGAPGANVEQVGFQLGYSESTAFIRAFKKWYGQTPGAYRRGGRPR